MRTLMQSLMLSSWIPLFVGGVLMVADNAAASATVTDLGGDRYRVVFRFKAQPGAKNVYVAGTFNGWDVTGHTMDGPGDGHVFETSLVLPKGRHEYKFVVDGRKWQTDPDNPHKTDGYRNAVLFLGIPAPDDAGTAVPAPVPVEMAGGVEHPPAVRRLGELLAGKGKTSPDGALDAWFAKNPMPLVADASVTFVYADARAAEVSVQLSAYGSRTGYAMHRLTDGQPVFAVSLDRVKLSDRAAYTFLAKREDRTERVVDPHAWSLTSRSGRSEALVVEASDRRGHIEVIAAFKPSDGPLRQRDIYVYLPPGYDRRADQRYPVLYMHDGQNCWDDPTEPFGHGGWCVNLAADRLIGAGAVEPFIVVGVANTPERMTEYGPGESVLSAADHPYIRFLVRDVKPRIDHVYRTQPAAKHTALMGSSMGGVISLQAALLKPDTFGMAACLSPAFGFADDSEQTYVDLAKKVGKVPVRLYLDSGTGGKGEDGAPLTRKMVALLREIGWKDGVDFMHLEDIGADHDERAWRARLDRPLMFLFGRQAASSPTVSPGQQ